MLSPEFENFCTNWLEKADAYGNSNHDHFDRFFTQFVVFNRVYAEATFRLAQQGIIRIPGDRFPDGKGAKEYILKFIGAQDYIAALGNSQRSTEAITNVVDLIRQGRFSIRLDMVHGTPQRGKDIQLMQDLLSPNAQIKGTAVLTFLYSIRCNTFHGRKDFNPVQTLILAPTNVLLRETIEIALAQLRK